MMVFGVVVCLITFILLLIIPILMLFVVVVVVVVCLDLRLQTVLMPPNDDPSDKLNGGPVSRCSSATWWW